MASLPMASRAEFSHQYFLVAAETCLQIFRLIIGALRSVLGQTSMGQGAMELRKIREAEDAFFVVSGESLTIIIWWFRSNAVYYRV